MTQSTQSTLTPREKLFFEHVVVNLPLALDTIRVLSRLSLKPDVAEALSNVAGALASASILLAHHSGGVDRDVDSKVFNLLSELESTLKAASEISIDALEDERDRKALALLSYAYEIVKELKSRDKLRSILL